MDGSRIELGGEVKGFGTEVPWEPAKPWQGVWGQILIS